MKDALIHLIPEVVALSKGQLLPPNEVTQIGSGRTELAGPRLAIASALAVINCGGVAEPFRRRLEEFRHPPYQPELGRTGFGIYQDTILRSDRLVVAKYSPVLLTPIVVANMEGMLDYPYLRLIRGGERGNDYEMPTQVYKISTVDDATIAFLEFLATEAANLLSLKYDDTHQNLNKASRPFFQPKIVTRSSAQPGGIAPLYSH